MASSAKQNELALKKEKTMKIKRTILHIVETMLEENISEENFLKKCVKLCQTDYDDVIQERNIVNLCGYPICKNPMKNMIKQQYHISGNSNKVYDLTERKCFCCNECYKASNFIKAQLSSIPLYMREDEPISLKLIPKEENKGSAGKEVEFQYSLSAQDIEKIKIENPKPNVLSDILHEEVKGCLQHLSNLTITEKTFEDSFSFKMRSDEKDKCSDEEVDAELTHSHSSCGSDDDDRMLFPIYDNMSVLSNKLMPIPDASKKAVLISPLKQDLREPNVSADNVSTEFLRRVLSDWLTEDTLKFLLGERKVYSLKADFLIQKMSSSDPETQSKIRNEYIDLCLKIDKLSDDDVSDLDDLDIILENSDANNQIKSIVQNKTGMKQAGKSEFKKGPKKKKNPVKKITSKEDTQSDAISKCSPPIRVNPAIKRPQVATDLESLPDPVFPLIDSVSQHGLRKNILVGKLKTAYWNILPVIGLHYSDIRKEVIGITETFSLTPTNITYTPKEWRCIAVVLFRTLTKTVLKHIHDDDNFITLCKTKGITSYACVEEMDKLANDFMSPDQLKRLQNVDSTE